MTINLELSTNKQDAGLDGKKASLSTVNPSTNERN